MAETVLGEIRQSLGRIEGLLQAVNARQDRHEADDAERHTTVIDMVAIQQKALSDLRVDVAKQAGSRSGWASATALVVSLLAVAASWWHK